MPWTNNGTEHAIGRMQMRSRTGQGYKTLAGLLNALCVTGSGVCCVGVRTGHLCVFFQFAPIAYRVWDRHIRRDN